MVQTSSSVNMSNGAVGHYALTESDMLLDPVTGNLKKKKNKSKDTQGILYTIKLLMKKVISLFIFFPFKNKCIQIKWMR